MSRLAGKSVIITGAGSGLGRAMTLRFVAEGARVLVTDINVAGGQETIALVGQLGAEDAVAFRQVDVTNEADCAGAVAEVVQRWGQLDVMVANAGIGALSPLITLSREEWDRVLAVNLTGVFLCAKHAFLAMQSRGGTIIATASIAALRGTPSLGAYGPSKAGVVQLVKTLALEGAPYNIRANALCPIWTDTPMVDRFASSVTPQDPNQMKSRMATEVPLGRLGTPDDVANAALFLASDEAAFITGTAFPIDGGHMAGR